MATDFAKLKAGFLKVAFTLSSKKVVNDLLRLGAFDLEGRMKQRIFNEGKNASDKKIGKYKSKSWKKKRNENGNQTGYVDLEFSGTLRRAIEVAEDSDGVYLAFINDEQFDIANGQELIQGKKNGQKKMTIFEPTTKETKAVQNYIDDLISERIQQIINRI